MEDRIADIVDRLESNRESIRSFFQPLSEKEQGVRVYEEEPGWTVRQVLAHLVTIEGSMHTLFDNILGGGTGFTADDFDVDRFNRSQPQKLDHLTLEEVLDRFASVRAKTISMAAEMDETDLNRKGNHPWHGLDKLERFVRWAYEHAGMHLKDAKQALARQEGK